MRPKGSAKRSQDQGTRLSRWTEGGGAAHTKGALGAVEESTGQNTAPIAQSSVNASSPTPAEDECDWIFGGLAAVIACGHRRCGA